MADGSSCLPPELASAEIQAHPDVGISNDRPNADLNAPTASSSAGSRIPDDGSVTDDRNASHNADHGAVTEAGATRAADGTADGATPTHARSSVFARNEDAPVHDVPMRVIHRPLPSELDEDKVLTFMDEMRGGDVFTPIEVVKVRAPLKADPARGAQTFYFAMGGCHRYEATKRLALPTIRARIIEVPPSAMRVYLGAGCPF